jgi:hypothetical protein
MMVDVQKKLDEWLADNPDAQKYVTKLWYIPGGTTPPADVTHTVRLQSVASNERHLMVGLVVKPQYAALIDVMLAMLATGPRI